MIDFDCPTCGKPFSLPDDWAGRDVQCADCGRLVGVPRAADLGNVNPDGTFKVAPAVAVPATPFDQLWWTFARTRPDAAALAAGVRRPAGGRPKSPPVDPAPAVLPSGVWLAAFRPLNLAVMASVVVAHLLFNVSIFVLDIGIVFFYFALPALAAMLIGHYGVVVDEIARADRDELPRPLRSLDWRDDLWLPFRDVSLVLAVLAAPLATAWYLSTRQPETFAVDGGFPTGELAVILTAVALVFAPALLLTLRTSGSLRNLRAGRVWGTICACGGDYHVVASVGLIAVPVMAAGVVVTAHWWLAVLSVRPRDDWGVFESFWASHGLMVVGVYLCHVLAWRIGLLYRMHHAAFPWVDQRSDLGDGPDVRLSPEERKALLEAKQSALRSAKNELLQDLQRTYGVTGSDA